LKNLEHLSFPELAQRACALYNDDEDALLLGMLGQEYIIRRSGIYLRGQKAPDVHAQVILQYLSAPDVAPVTAPWRSFKETASADFRKRIEAPIMHYADDIISRAHVLLPMVDAQMAPSIIGSTIAINARALPKVYLHLELSEESQDFPSEAWLLFSHNADAFLSVDQLHILAEMFKDRLLGLLRIY